MQCLILHPPRGFHPYGPQAAVEIKRLFQAHTLEIGKRVDAPHLDAVGEAAAEEAFELTNNPSRQDERERCYGRHRSISVGDVVIVENTGGAFYCAPSGWVQFE